jgi:hypothetical protein
VIKFKIQLLCLLPEIRLVDKDDNSYYHIIIINIDDMGLLVCDKGPGGSMGLGSWIT